MANMMMRRETERTKKRMKNKESFERRKGSSIEHKYHKKSLEETRVMRTVRDGSR